LNKPQGAQVAGKRVKRTSGYPSSKRNSGLLGRLGRVGRQKLTIMLIPHSEKRVFNFQISLLALSFISILLISLVVTFVWLTADFSGTNDLLASRSRDLEHSEASLEVLRDEGYGNFVVIRHKYGFYTKYAHLQRTYVRPGQDISQGDVLGTMGNTGLSTGPHLHYEVRIGSQVVDPVKYINMTDNHDIFNRVTRNLQKYK
jgi:hypothetical protein